MAPLIKKGRVPKIEIITHVSATIRYPSRLPKFFLSFFLVRRNIGNPTNMVIKEDSNSGNIDSSKYKANPIPLSMNIPSTIRRKLRTFRTMEIFISFLLGI